MAIFIGVVLSPVDFDDDPVAVREQEQEVHPLACNWPWAHALAPGAGASRRVSAMTGIVRLVFCWYPANPG